MEVYIMTDTGKYYYMDAVFDVSFVQSGSASQYAMQSGVKVSDHYSQELDTININGAVSSVKFVGNGSNKTDLSIFEKELTALKKSGEPFSVMFSDNIGVVSYCLFTSLTMSRTTATGEHCIDVQMGIQRIKYATASGIVSTPKPAKEYADIIEAKKSGTGNTKELNTKEKSALEAQRDLYWERATE